MIPYLGCKEKWAKYFLSLVPAAENFYDLFGGGGSVTEAAFKIQENGMFGHWKKWRNVHYNEINKGVYELNKAIWNGDFNFDYAKKEWITKERYFAERRQPTAWGAFISFFWSFGNKDESYIYSERRLAAKCQDHLKNIRRAERSPFLPEIKLTNKDYREVHIKKQSVVYCDIPYNINRNHYKVRFDHNAFYKWAISVPFPIYFSDYNIPPEFSAWFAEIWNKEIYVRIHLGIKRTERVFWNRKKLN